jgi:hypothetical protein
MQFKVTRKRIIWGCVSALAFGLIGYGNILNGRWSRPFGIVALVVLPAFALFLALTVDFTQTPEKRETARKEAKNRIILWIVTVVVMYFVFKINYRYHLLP